MAAPCLRTKIDSGVQLLSALYVSVLLFSVGSVCALRHSSSSHKTQGLGVYHFPDRYSSRFHDELSQQQIPQNKDILQLQQDVLSVFPSLADGLSQARNDVRNGLEIPHLRRKREVTQATVQKQVSENATGQLIDIAGELGDSISRTFVLVEASAHGDMFKVTELGKLELKKGYKLDYEDSTMRQITFTVDATSRTNTSDVTRVTTVLSLSNEDEPPVFITQPKPYMATISTDTGPGHVIIKLVAQDPEGRPVHYQKFSVQPSQIYDQRIELRTEIVNGVRECWLLTTGSDRFPAGGEIRVTVKARDDPNSGSEDTVMVLIKVGMMAPQFYQGSYEGSMHERNQPGQSVYKQGTLDELRVQIKTFQDGPVTMSLEKEGGGNSDLFSINNEGYIICNQELDYETINPKIQSLIVKASQRVGTTNQESQATLKVEIIDANDHTPTFDKSQYLHTMPEDSLPSSSVLSVTARDGDTGENARVVYSLLDSEPDAQFFQISTESVSSTVYTGVIRVKKRLDYDRKEGPYYNFQVVATDNGNPASSSITSVRVTVTNVNDEHPQFINIDEDDIIVMETAPTGQYITQVQATDKDGDQVTYSISSIVPATSGATAFNIDRSTGVITLGREIRPADDRFTVTIMAQDDGSCCQGSTTLTNTTQIFVQVSGENQNKPNFDNCNGYSVNIPEHSEIGFSVQTVSASDPDRGPNGRVTYEITAPKDIFTINPTTGLISVSQDIDREALTDPFKQVTLRATDNGNPPLAAWCTFRVTITDINDHKPTFGVTHYMTNITMDLRPKVPFLTITARDQDVGKNARINYSLVDDGNGKFGIIPENGFIFLESALTETDVTYNLTALAKDNGSPPLNATVAVVVNVKTGSTQPPSIQFDKNYTDPISESVAEGTEILTMTCTSNIQDPRVEFQLIDKDGNPTVRTEYFYITPSTSNPNKITVFATGRFDYYLNPAVMLKIRCLNFGPFTLMTEARREIKLIDTNNKVPEFLGLVNGRYSGSVKEGAPAGTSIMTVVVRDEDATALYKKVTFTLADNGNNFTIDQSPDLPENTAIIRTNRVFDREQKLDYFVQVNATDGAPSSSPLVYPEHNSRTLWVQVQITDINDNAPFFPKDLYHVKVNESFYMNQYIEPPIAVDDVDSSDTGRHTYRIISGNGDPQTFGVRNGLGSLYLLRNLDYERGDKNFNLQLEASDGRFSATTTVTVTVLDVNDNPPKFLQETYTFSDIVENDSNPQNPILTVSATDADRERPNQIRYRLESSSFDVNKYFRLNPVTGELSVISPLDRDRPTGFADYQMTVEATDEAVNPNKGFASISIQPQDINDNDPFFLDEPLVGSVKENSPQGTPVVPIRTDDYDEGENSTVDMSITSIVDKKGADRSGYFSINNKDVLITATAGSNLDRETEDTYYVTIKLQDRGNPPRSSSGVMTVTLADDNDQKPTFQPKYYSITMSESQTTGEVIRIVATDDDLGENAKITYELPKESDREHFKVENINEGGSIQVYAEVDYENNNQREFNLTLWAKDNAGHQDECYVYIKVIDFNDNPPSITPKTGKTNVSEDAVPGTPLFKFSAMDIDSGDNKEFEFSIRRDSDRLRQFFIDPNTGEVKTQRPLDRETVALYELIIQAIDKGSPPLTGTASLTVDVTDVNDNYPKFKEDYHPHVRENNKTGIRDIVQRILAEDPDDPPYDIPYGFELTTCPGNSCPCAVKPTCPDTFRFVFDRNGDGGNGSATIWTVKTDFDRERQKYYEIPIVMWDMRGTGSNKAMTGTNTLTVTIADVNDNEMFPGTQNMFVYNYKGMFGPLEIGRVYVEDQDDWDLPDKTFIFKSPDWMKAYFTVNNDTGMVTMQKGVPSNTADKPYTFQVDVYDNTRNEHVMSTVKVTVRELSEEAVRNSGAVRLKDISAEEFIHVPKTSNPQQPLQSKSAIFQAMLAKELQTDVANVEIISVQDVEGGFVDVRYTAHGSPYYPASQTDSMVYLNKNKFEQAMDATLSVPIDACSEEVFEGGCYNYMNITGQPALVNSNGTSFVGVEVFIQAKEGCRALDFPEPKECSGDYCYHGGTCVQDDFGVLSCINCPDGFNGPRCQQLSHSFSGNQYALYDTLEQCENSETSIEFITRQADGLLLYNGPMKTLQAGQPKDFIALALHSGMPVLNIDHGSGAITMSLNGRDQQGTEVMSALNDGMWHKIDIIRKGKVVEMIVDDCKTAQNTGGSSLDTTPCRVVRSTQGENSFLNVASLLQVGGRPKSSSYPPSGIVTTSGFNGCVKNLVHNSKIYDLYFKNTPGLQSGENGCPRENCEGQCGVNGICTGSFLPTVPATCTCKPGWRGSECNTVTTVRDLQVASYIQWQLKDGETLPSNQLELQVMYRSYYRDGVLFTVSSQGSTTKSVTLELRDSHLQARYDLGNGQRTLQLSKTNASNGQWHVARFKRVMHLATLILDGGEGANYASERTDPSDNVYMDVWVNSSMYSGAIVTSSQGAEVIDRDLQNTCIQDVRINNKWMPMKTSEDQYSLVANFKKDKNVTDGCSRPNGCLAPTRCPANAICVNLWGWYKCKCSSGYHEIIDGACESDCQPDNPCFHDAVCEIDNGTLVCDCTPFINWGGPLCNVYSEENDREPQLGMAGGTIAAIVVAIIVAILLLVLAVVLISMYNRRKNNDSEKFVVEDDADFDIRENVMFYDEEGAGEEDQNAFDLAKLPNPVSDPIKPDHVDDVHRRNTVPLGKSVPDVGDVLQDRMGDADDDPDAPPYDTLIAFNDEGAGSDAGSLSSLGSSSSDASQDYDYLNDWGPKFAKLADMYGAGQDE